MVHPNLEPFPKTNAYILRVFLHFTPLFALFHMLGAKSIFCIKIRLEYIMEVSLWIIFLRCLTQKALFLRLTYAKKTIKTAKTA